MSEESEDLPPLNQMWKVPFREVYCFTFRSWLAQTIYCHVVLRIDAPKLPNLPKGE